MPNTERIRTIGFTCLSAILGALAQRLIEIPIAPALFGVAVLAANHRFIRYRFKSLLYFLMPLISTGVFVFAAMPFGALWVYATESVGLAILAPYVASGGCALTIASFFEIVLTNVKLSFVRAMVLVLLGAASLLAFYRLTDQPVDQMFVGSVFKNYEILFLVWQTLVGIGIGYSILPHPVRAPNKLS